MPTYREILNLPTGDFRPAMAGYDAGDDMMKVKSIQKKMRDSFTRPLTDLWDVVTSGGATATVSGGLLTVASGTTAGGYAELLSKETFTIPFRSLFGVLNTRHASNHQLIEAVSVDPLTGIPDGRHSIDMDIGGAASTTVTQMVYGVQNGGLRSLRSSAAASVIATTATLTILELEPFSDETYFHSRANDSTAGRSASYVRHQQIPDPTAVYKLRIRSMNHGAWNDTVTAAVAGTGGVIRLTSTAHGRATNDVLWVEQLNGVTNNGAEVRGNFTITVVDANTIELNGTIFGGVFVAGSGRFAQALAPTAVSLQLQYVNCQDYAELTAEITAGRGNIVEGQAIAARMVAGSTTAVTGIVTTTPNNPTTTNINSAATTNATLVKNAAGNLYSLSASNIGAAARYLKLYNKATAPVPGTDTPVLTIKLPADSVTVLEWGAVGLRFATGIGLAITAGAADADVAAVVAAEVKVNASYL
jgi:hypothetical protein